MIARMHAIERTSPKGENEDFIGTCRLCGKTGLRLWNAREYCENPVGLSDDDALLMALEMNGGAPPPLQ